ncbi:MAG: phosphate ABC transporter permease PstA, partial [Gemmatimonadaceae bacterium]
MTAARGGRSMTRRHVTNHVMVALTYAAALGATLPLVFILTYLMIKGATSINFAFFTQLPPSPGEAGGGMGNAIVGTLMLIGIAAAIGLPVGIGSGLYLAEKRDSKLATVVRFLADVLNGLPSIVVGIFAWQVLVRRVGHFSALAGG